MFSPHTIFAGSFVGALGRFIGAIGLALALGACGSTGPSLAPKEVPPPSGAVLQERLAQLYAEGLDLERRFLYRQAIDVYSDILQLKANYLDVKDRQVQLAGALGLSVDSVPPPSTPTFAPPTPREWTPLEQPQSSRPEIPTEPEIVPQDVAPSPRGLQREALWDELYERARSHEREHLYLTAIDLYTELLTGRGSYKDAALRRKTLVSLHSLAEKLYAQAIGADKREVLLDHLEQIEVFWPEFRDVSDRLAQLRAR